MLWVLFMLLHPLLQTCEELCMDQMPVLLREDFSVFIERPVTSAEAPRLVHIPTRHATTPSGPLGNSSTILIHFVVIGPRPVRPHAQVTMGKMEFAFSEHRQHVGGLSGMMIAKSLEPSAVEARLDLPRESVSRSRRRCPAGPMSRPAAPWADVPGAHRWRVPARLP